MNTGPVPGHVWVYAILWTLAFVFLSGFSAMTLVLIVILMVGILGHGKTTVRSHS